MSGSVGIGEFCFITVCVCAHVCAALGNLAYKVPPHLIQMVEEENAKLQQRR